MLTEIASKTLYSEFIGSISDSALDWSVQASDQELMQYAMFNIVRDSLGITYADNMYFAAVEIYLLLKNHDLAPEEIEPEEDNIDKLFVIALLGDVMMAYIEDKRSYTGELMWPEYARILLSCLLGSSSFEIPVAA